MNLFSGFSFFVYLFVLLLPAVVIGINQKPLKVYRIVLTIFFIYQIYKTNLTGLICFGLYILLMVYLVKIYVLLRKKYGKNKYICGHCIFVAVLPLILIKVSPLLFEDGTPIIQGIIGTSYICFRVIQVILEIYDGVIIYINEVQFVEFLIFFPTLSSGPIDRSRRFACDDNSCLTREEYIALLENGIFKIVLGLFYKIVCADIAYNVLNTFFAGRYKPLFLIGYAYMYGLYLFFDFAGYSSMAVGVSYVLGIRMPENFNKPFISVDIKEFWNRWHITLSHWFRDFVFSRILLDFIKKKWFSDRLQAAGTAFILNMTIMGLWHGLESQYVIYGIYHGVLLAFTQIYQKKSNFYKKYKHRAVYKLCSWFLTINFVMLGFLIFSGYLNKLYEIMPEILY